MATLKARGNHHAHRNHYDLYGDVEKIKSALLDTTGDIKGKAGEMFSGSMDEIKQQTLSIKDNLESYTSDKPFKSLGIAVLTGIAIGLFMMRK